MATLTDSHNASTYQNLFIGCVLAICGNLLISFSLNIQKYSHMRNVQREIQQHYTKDPAWWAGLLLMCVGETGNFTAYGFAPASLVAPLGTTTVIANLFLSAIILKEKILYENLFGCCIAVIGAILLVIFSSEKEVVLDAEEIVHTLCQVSFIVYVCSELALLAVLFFLLYSVKIEHVAIYLLISSVTAVVVVLMVCLSASFTVISAKAVSGLIQISFGVTSWFGHPILYVMLFVLVATAVVQIKYLNQAMKMFNSSVVVPTYFVFFTLSAIVAGIVFYKEFHGMKAMDIVMFLFGCLLSFVSVYFITTVGVFEEHTDFRAIHQVKTDSSPAWLLANLHVGRVQPYGSVPHPSTCDEQMDSVSEHRGQHLLLASTGGGQVSNVDLSK